MTTETPPKSNESTGAPKAVGGLAALIAGAVAITGPLASRFEGERLHPYRDPAGIMTVCDGETNVAMHDYTQAECAAMLQNHLSRVYAPMVLRCVPALAAEPRTFVLAASIDAAYNAGTNSFCHSPMARLFNAGQWKAGCDRFKGWFVSARVHGKLKRLNGLVRRRLAESQLCMRGASQ